MWCTVGEQRHESLQIRWSTHAGTKPSSWPQAFETYMPPSALISPGGSGVGGERGTEERWRKRGELMESRVVSQLIGDALPGLQCLLFPSWLPDAIMNCTDKVRLWILTSGCTAQHRTFRGMVCNMSVLLYTCAVVMELRCVSGWPGNCLLPAVCGRPAWLLRACV